MGAAVLELLALDELPERVTEVAGVLVAVLGVVVGVVTGVVVALVVLTALPEVEAEPEEEAEPEVLLEEALSVLPTQLVSLPAWTEKAAD